MGLSNELLGIMIAKKLITIEFHGSKKNALGVNDTKIYLVKLGVFSHACIFSDLWHITILQPFKLWRHKVALLKAQSHVHLRFAFMIPLWSVLVLAQSNLIYIVRGYIFFVATVTVFLFAKKSWIFLKRCRGVCFLHG